MKRITAIIRLYQNNTFNRQHTYFRLCSKYKVANFIGLIKGTKPAYKFDYSNKLKYEMQAIRQGKLLFLFHDRYQNMHGKN